MKRRLVLVLATLALGLGGAGAAQATHQQASPVSIERTCGRGYVHAIINHKEKCLRKGEFCSHRYERDYRKYGFTCGANGHLRRR